MCSSDLLVNALGICGSQAAALQEFLNDGSWTKKIHPGYGDLPLALQKDIFRVLDCPKRIGLTLNESLLMSPSKSVTALIGVSGSGETLRREAAGCGSCGQKNCAFRRTV